MASIKQTFEMFSKERINLGNRPEEGWTSKLFKAVTDAANPVGSNQTLSPGRKEHPFNYESAKKFRDFNGYHSTCISTKTHATVGLGFRSPNSDKIKKEKVDPNNPNGVMDAMLAAKNKLDDLDEQTKAEEILDPLCETSLQDLMNRGGEDYYDLGNWAMEVVREARPNGKILALHPVEAKSCHVVIENSINKHYEIGGFGTADRKFAAFGDWEFEERLKQTKGNTRSEIIMIQKPSALARWYGYPDWIPCVVAVELMHMMGQYYFDFFNNRGVPEFFLWILGGQLEDKEWKDLKAKIRANIGQGNSHKSFAGQIPNSEAKIQIDKLGSDGGKQDAQQFQTTVEACSLMIVSAHRVPPLLAGIQIPGKLGANNELPNALTAFQALVIGQEQKTITSRLAHTLGDPKKNGGLPLERKDFLFRRITDVIDVGNADTISRMRQPLAQANAEGRNLEQGLKKAMESVKDPEEVARAIGREIDRVIDRLITSPV